MAAFTRANPIGWSVGSPVTSAQMNALDLDHVKTINVVDGLATYNPAGVIQIGGAGFRWNAGTLFSATSTTTWAGSSTIAMEGTMTVSATGSIVIGSSGELTVQSGGEINLEDGSAMTWADGSLIQAEDGSTFQLADGSVINFGGIVNFGATSEIFGAPRLASAATFTAQSGSTIAAASGSTVTLGGTTTVTQSQPSSSADPGADNRLVGTNLVKAWGAVHIDTGVVTVLDGYNVSNVTISLSSIGVVTLARAMANADYAVVISIGGNQHQRKYATVQATSKSTTVFRFNVWDEIAGTNVDLTDASTDIVVSFLVMGRQ
jgi:hypothetical protein